MATASNPRLWKPNTALAVTIAIMLAFVFAAMRGVGTLGPIKLRFLLPLGFVLMTALPWVLMTRFGRFEMGLRRPLHASWFMTAVVLGALASFLCFATGIGLFGHGIDNWYVSVAKNFAQTAPVATAPKLTLYLMFTLTAMVFSPLGEEMFFRGLFQKALEERFTAKTSTWIESAAFGLVHLCHHGLIVDALGFRLLPKSAFLWFALMTAVAYLFAWLRKSGASLYLAMASHSAFNFVMGTSIFIALWPPAS